MPVATSRVAGVDPGQRALNGPQTTGREYRDLSAPEYAVVREDDVPAVMRDGARLLTDVYRPEAEGRFPALVAASCYPRQIQDVGAPMGFIEAGASDFFVPRGYGHVIANVRGTGQSDGEFTLFDGQERRDMHDLVEWVAAQPWCDGRVGMIGISYFAMTQLEAAVEQPPHLQAIFPVATSPDLYEAVRHHGLLNAGFVSPWLFATAMAAHHDATLWRGRLLDAVRAVLRTPAIHSRLQNLNGEAALATMKKVLRGEYDPEPWDRLWREVVVEHPLRDAFWDEHSTLDGLRDVRIPVYLGCDWDNVPLHLPGTFGAWEALRANPQVRMGMMPPHGLSWPWESLHVEALAWFDHWLKDRDTGITEGPRVRYWLPGAEGWRTATDWPPPEAVHREWALAGDGTLGGDVPGERRLLTVDGDVGRPPHVHAPEPAGHLSWDSPVLERDVDVAGDVELRLDAALSDADGAWIVVLQDVAPDGATTDVTAGHLRAMLREVDDAASRPGAPVLPCRTAVAVPPGEVVAYRIPLVPTARRFAAGHRIRLVVAGDDRDPSVPAPLDFRHAPIGGPVGATVHATSRLVLPTLAEAPG